MAKKPNEIQLLFILLDDLKLSSRTIPWSIRILISEISPKSILETSCSVEPVGIVTVKTKSNALYE